MEPIRPVDAAAILGNAIQDAHKWEAPLGAGRKGKAEKAFEAMSKGRIELGNPGTHLQALKARDFEMRGLELSPEVSKSMQGQDGYAFYILPVPVLLFPGRGARYRLVESQLRIAAPSGQRQPAIYSVFPEPYWKPVLDWGGKLDLNLDGSLRWGAEVDQTEARIGKLGGELSGRVKNVNRLAGFMRVIPFEHTLGRMEVEAQYASNTAMWRLDSKQVIRGEKHVKFVLLLKVPKEVSQLHIEAAAQAEVAYDWLTAQVEHVLKHLSQAIRDALQRRRGLPLQDFQEWVVTLPSG